MICSLGFWDIRARAQCLRENCAFSCMGMVRCGYQTFKNKYFRSVCVLFSCDALILLAFDECKHWFTDWLRKKCCCCSYCCCIALLWMSMMKREKNTKNDRYTVAAWILLKLQWKYKAHLHQKTSYLPIELNWTMKEQKEAGSALMWTHWANLR